MGCDMYSVANKSSYHYLSAAWIYVCMLCAMVYCETQG
jgi:hypothetical protein